MPLANLVQAKSRINGRLYEFADDEEPAPISDDSVEGMERLRAIGEAVRSGWEWVWKSEAAQEAQKAIAMLNALPRP